MQPVPTPAGQVVITREYCLQRAAGLLASADYNFSTINGVPNQTALAAVVESQVMLAQTFIQLHDRL